MQEIPSYAGRNLKSHQLKYADVEYTLIDCATGLIYGPFETCNQARDRADEFAAWEILNHDGDLVDWSRSPTRRQVKAGAQTRGVKNPVIFTDGTGKKAM